VINQRCQLFLGDCLEVLPTLEAGSVDAIITDLPYGTTACKWDEVIPFAPMWEQVKRLLKPNGVFVTTASQPFTSRLVASNLDWFRHEWVWKKDRGSNFANTIREPMKEHEQVLVFGRGGWTYNKQMQPRKPSGLSRVKYDLSASAHSDNYRAFERDGRRTVGELRGPSSVQEFNRETGRHPTQKPVALYEYLIRTYTNEGDTVLDFTCGSGTTAVACINTNRNFVGVELDAGYHAIAQRRIAEAQAQPALLEFA
jgi:site-specific DNA-methyltransferase (adenine-specific)